MVWYGKSLPYNPRFQERARDLRRKSTREENKLWYDFLAKHAFKFLIQKVIGNYIVDFYCAQFRLVIEVDGSQHYTDMGMKYDAIHTEYLEQFKITIIRCTNAEIKNNFPSVCQQINEALKKSPPNQGGCQRS